MPRVQRRFLLGSRWTARSPLPHSQGECHFEVVGVVRGVEVTMRAVLTGSAYTVALAALEDSAAWQLGWQAIPPDPDSITRVPPGE